MDSRVERPARAGRELVLTKAPPPPSFWSVLRESKEMVFILLGITLAFTIHFGFGDVVQTESSIPKVRSPLPASEVGSSERVRAEAFERAEERAVRRRVARRARARRVAAARAAAARAAATSPPASRTRTRSTPTAPSGQSAPAVSSPSPAPRPAPSKPRPAPASSGGGGGGGGQSFDDSG